MTKEAQSGNKEAVREETLQKDKKLTNLHKGGKLKRKGK